MNNDFELVGGEIYAQLGKNVEAETKSEVDPKDVIPITLAIILDNSGSMYNHKEDTITGVMDFIDKQKEIAEEGFNLYIYKFDTKLYRRVYGGPIQNAPNLIGMYNPQGKGTALYESMYKCMGRIKELTSTDKKQFVIFCVVTDGEDNRGIYNTPQYTAKDCFDRVKSDEYSEWKFYYMGAVANAKAQGKKLGVTDPECCIQFDQKANNGQGTSQAFRIMSKHVYQSVESAYQSLGKNT